MHSLQKVCEQGNVSVAPLAPRVSRQMPQSARSLVPGGLCVATGPLGAGVAGSLVLDGPGEAACALEAGVGDSLAVGGPGTAVAVSETGVAGCSGAGVS